MVSNELDREFIDVGLSRPKSEIMLVGTSSRAITVASAIFAVR